MQSPVSLITSFSPKLPVLLHLHVCGALSLQGRGGIIPEYFYFQADVCLDSFKTTMEEFSWLKIHTVSSKCLGYQGRCSKNLWKTAMHVMCTHRTASGWEKDMNSLKWHLVPIFRPLSQAPNAIFRSKSYSRHRYLYENLR